MLICQKKEVKLMKKVFFICLVPIFSYSYTLQELVELSHKNRLVESSSYMLNSKQSLYDSVKKSYLPKVDISLSYQNAAKESISMAQDSIKGSASVKYTIYDGEKEHHLYNQHLKTIDASKKSVEAFKNDISLDVVKLYYDYLSYVSDIESTKSFIVQLEAEHKRLKNFFDVGSVTKDELDKIDSRLKNAIFNLHEIELNIQKTISTLQYYTMQENIVIDSGSSVKYIEGAVGVRADIEAMESEASSLMYEAYSKKSSNLPTLFFDNTISRTEYYFDDKSKEGSFLVDTQNIATLNLSWNILDFGAITKGYESKYYEYLSKKSELEYEKYKADVDYKLAKKSLEIALLKIDASKSTLDAAEATYNLVKVRYEGGIVDNVAYLQSLNEMYDAKRAYQRAIYDTELKKAELLYFSAKDIKEYL